MFAHLLSLVRGSHRDLTLQKNFPFTCEPIYQFHILPKMYTCRYSNIHSLCLQLFSEINAQAFDRYIDTGSVASCQQVVTFRGAGFEIQWRACRLSLGVPASHSRLRHSSSFAHALAPLTLAGSRLRRSSSSIFTLPPNRGPARRLLRCQMPDTFLLEIMHCVRNLQISE